MGRGLQRCERYVAAVWGRDLERTIEHAQPFPIAGVLDADESLEDLLAEWRNGTERALSTGWAPVDRYYTVQPGELTIVTGIPSHGKSQWLEGPILNLAEGHGWGNSPSVVRRTIQSRGISSS